jgi:hypothetical protein
MREILRRWVWAALVSLMVVGHASIALAGAHTWDVNEVFSDPTGDIQFIELKNAGGAAENGIVGQTLSSDAESLTIGGSAAGDTTDEHYLIATQAFADLPNAPTPDHLIPSGSIPFFSAGGDTIDYGPYDSWNFASIPTNGSDSLDRTSGVGINTPTNFAGETGTVDVSTSTVPTMSIPGISTVAGLLALAGAAFVLRLRRRRLAV